MQLCCSLSCLDLPQKILFPRNSPERQTATGALKGSWCQYRQTGQLDHYGRKLPHADERGEEAMEALTSLPMRLSLFQFEHQSLGHVIASHTHARLGWASSDVRLAAEEKECLSLAANTALETSWTVLVAGFRLPSSALVDGVRLYLGRQ